jgi:hypothetical protein
MSQYIYIENDVAFLIYSFRGKSIPLCLPTNILHCCTDYSTNLGSNKMKVLFESKKEQDSSKKNPIKKFICLIL